ncbi:hypothetical protein, partial [Pontiella sp.]|uniref:hypothetical protein n=1 Tax=Pontiella sp. TaxID=2837462 RepID=UPI003563DB0E
MKWWQKNGAAKKSVRPPEADFDCAEGATQFSLNPGMEPHNSAQAEGIASDGHRSSMRSGAFPAHSPEEEPVHESVFICVNLWSKIPEPLLALLLLVDNSD